MTKTNELKRELQYYVGHEPGCRLLKHLSPDESCDCLDGTTNIEKVMALITRHTEAAVREAEVERNRVLLALVGMYEQYCPGRLGHNFMGAGEDAIEIIEEYGLGNEIDGIDEAAVAALSNKPRGYTT